MSGDRACVEAEPSNLRFCSFIRPGQRTNELWPRTVSLVFIFLGQLGGSGEAGRGPGVLATTLWWPRVLGCIPGKGGSEGWALKRGPGAVRPALGPSQAQTRLQAQPHELEVEGHGASPMQIFQAQDGQKGLGAGLGRDPEAKQARPRSPRSAHAGAIPPVARAPVCFVRRERWWLSRKAAVGKLPGGLPSPVWLSLRGAGGKAWNQVKQE